LANSSKAKPGRFAKLPRSQRNRVRVVARDAWFESGGSVQVAIPMACDRVRLVAGSDYVRDGEALAVKLLRYWDSHGIFEPESIFVPGEPGFDGGDE
jgi:hypothetical protein